MSILRHDTRHHLSAIRTLIQQGESDKALEYLNEVSQTYDDTVIKTYCRNEMVNSVLSIYNMRFEEQRIRWEITEDSLGSAGQYRGEASLFGNDVLCDPVKRTGKCHACRTGTAAGKAADTAGSVRKVRTSSSDGEKYCAECPGIY